MATKEQKKLDIRSQILDATDIYSRQLAGKVFLYVVKDAFAKFRDSEKSSCRLALPRRKQQLT